jgi:hypothetical protein
MNKRVRYILVAGLMITCAHGWAVEESSQQTEIIRDETSEQKNIIPDPDIPISETAPPVATPTGPPAWQEREDALWDLLRAGRLDDVAVSIREISSDYPEWTPPDRLTQLLREAHQRKALESSRGDPAALIEMAAMYPQLFGCNEIGNSWALADAHVVLGESERAAEIYRQLLGQCVDAGHRLTTLQKSASVMNVDDYRSLLDAETERYPTPDQTLDQMRLASYREAATQAAGNGDWSVALDYLANIDEVVLRLEDADAARLNAWSLRELGRPGDAVPWLERAVSWTNDPGVRADLAMTYMEAGDEERAELVAAEIAEHDADSRKLLYGLVSERAATALENQQCGEALRLGELAGTYGTPERPDHFVEAWALYQCSEYAASAEAFTRLYEAQADDDSARGIILNDYHLQRLEHAAGIAAGSGGPLAEKLPSETDMPRRRGAIDYSRLTLSKDATVSVIRDRGWAALGGVGWSSRQGDGPSRLDAWRLPLLELEISRDLHRFEFQATRLQLDSDSMEPGDFPMNTRRVTTRGITESASGLWEPLASWVYKGDLEWLAVLGATPVEGVVSSTWQGRIGAARRDSDSGWEFSALRVPVSESVLSWTGVKGFADVDGARVIFPFTWGRVTRNGIETSAYIKQGQDWTLSGSLRAGSYRGKNVPDNNGGQFYGMAERELRRTDSAAVSLGPYVYLSAFEDNLGKFTPGHGGYFSPSWLYGAGLAGRYRKQSAGHPWYLELRASAGYQRHKEDSAELIPDSGLRQQFLDALNLQPGDLGSFGSNTETGFAGTLELEGLRRIGQSRWHWGGYLRGRVSPEFDNYAAMLLLRFGSRQNDYEIRRQFAEPFRMMD